ncbi:sensor histidine kinase, partial [Mesorhizobium sp. M1329]
CSSLAASMIGETQAIAVNVMAENGRIDSQKAVSLGLIVTELVLNAIKYAFSTEKVDALILVTYETDAEDWKLTVSDNGWGKPVGDIPGAGLGTAIVEALVKQLEARIDTVTGNTGTTIAVTRATFTSRMPKAA